MYTQSYKKISRDKERKENEKREGARERDKERRQLRDKLGAGESREHT